MLTIKQQIEQGKQLAREDERLDISARETQDLYNQARGYNADKGINAIWDAYFLGLARGYSKEN